MGIQYGDFGTTTATIPSGSNTSGTIDCLVRGSPAELHMPAAFDGATVTFQNALTNDGTYLIMRKDGADVSVTVTASRAIWLDPSIFYAAKYLRIVSASNETAERAIEVNHRKT